MSQVWLTRCSKAERNPRVNMHDGSELHKLLNGFSLIHASLMRYFILLPLLLTTFFVCAQPSMVASKVYSLKDTEVIERQSGKRMPMLLGSSRDFDYLEMHATSLRPGASPHAPHAHDDIEEVIIVKEGVLEVDIAGDVQNLEAGSVAMIMPGDPHGIRNASSKETVYYTLRYRSKSPKDQERGTKAGGSFFIHWKEIPFREKSKGGVRSFFERPTAMCERFEMHVTTLNPGLQSHPPHQHRAGEIILMVEGTTREQINNKYYEAESGDFYFLESESEHTIKNIGKDTCTYFAFQFN